MLAVIVVGAFYVNADNLTPYFPYGLSGAATGAATVFGYDAMSTAAEESKDAERNLPKAIIISLAIAMVLYLLAATVLTGMQKYTALDDHAAYAAAFNSVGLPNFAKVAFGAILGIITVLFRCQRRRVPLWSRPAVSRSRCRYPLRRLVRSGSRVPYAAPHTLSGSADSKVFKQVRVLARALGAGQPGSVATADGPRPERASHW